MSANLLDGVTPTPMSGTTEDGGVWHCPAKDGKYDRIAWSFSGMSALTANQTYHLGLSVKGASANASDLHMVIAYKDAAGNRNWAWSDAMPVGTEWSRSEATVVVPSGMTMTALTVSTNSSAKLPEVWLTSPTLSLGSPVPLATSAHTPYATQDHLAAEYATKAALKVTSDAVTAEVEERGKLAGRVGTLESTSGTHTSKLEQLASSIRSLVRGESTYTDPDGKSATSGIYSLVTQTRDAVTALFGSYTKTADLASTQAVKDAKKAGTDAQAAASAAQTTANSAKSAAQAAASDAATAKTNASTAVSTANDASTSAANAVETANAASSTASSASSTANSAASTANAAKTSAASAVSTANAASSTASSAKSTADSLATMIREDATGITVGKSADGKTYATGRTHMGEDSFDVLDKDGHVSSSFGATEQTIGQDSDTAKMHLIGGRATIGATRVGDVAGVKIQSDAVDMVGGSGGAGVKAEFATIGEAGVGASLTSELPTVGLWATDEAQKDEPVTNSFSLTPAGYELSDPVALSKAVDNDGWHVLLDGGAWYCKRGGLLLVYLYNITASGSRTVGTLPTGYRPLFPDGADNVFGVAVGPNGYSCNFGINAGGEVDIYPTTSGDWTGLGVFPVAW